MEDCRITGVDVRDVRFPTSRDRVIEYVEELHEHFIVPVEIRDGRYVVPDTPGYSIEMRPESLEEYAFPGGGAWR